MECYSVVVRRSAIEKRYPGGMAAYRADSPNHTLCADENLVRVGFMASGDIEEFLVRVLSRADLVRAPTEERKTLTMDARWVAIVEEGRGPWHPDACRWLGYAQRIDGVCMCWLEGQAQGELAAPPGWTPEAFVKLPPEATCDAATANQAGETVRLYQGRTYPPKVES